MGYKEWNISDVKNEIKKACDVLDIETPRIPITSTNMYKTYGYFQYAEKLPYKFNFSKFLLDGRFDDVFVIDVVRHEVAHYYDFINTTMNDICEHSNAHMGKTFLQACKKLHCTSTSGLTKEYIMKYIDDKIAFNKSKYVTECPKCKRRYYFNTKVEKVKYPEKYKHKKCKVEFVRIK